MTETKETPTPARSLTLIDIVGRTGVLLGAIGGSVWGYMGYGVMGAITGVPIGAIMGLMFTLLFVVMGFGAVFCVGASRAYLRGGRKGFAEYWHNELVGPDVSPATPTDSVQRDK